MDGASTSSEPSAPPRSRRSSSHSSGGLDIPAASAVAGVLAASPELPYMTPPVTQANFSGDSQDSSSKYTRLHMLIPKVENQNHCGLFLIFFLSGKKYSLFSEGYTSISVREPLANIIAQTKQMNKNKRELDPHYSTVSDDSGKFILKLVNKYG